MLTNQKGIIGGLILIGIGLTLAFIPTLFVKDFDDHNDRFRFGAAVRFYEKDADHFCNGRVRNKFLFGYYQIDKVLCHYKTPGQPGSNTLWTAGFDQKPSMIVHEDDLHWLFAKHTDETTGYQSFTGIEPSNDHIEESMSTVYVDIKDNVRRFNYTGEIVKPEPGDPKKLDKLLYGDKDECLGFIDGFLWIKSLVKEKIKENSWVSGCKRVHPELKKHKHFSKFSDEILTDLWGGKANAKKEFEEKLKAAKAKAADAAHAH